MKIMELDLSSQTIIVMVNPNGVMLVPKGELVLTEGDCVVLNYQERIFYVNKFHIRRINRKSNRISCFSLTGQISDFIINV